MRYDATDSIKRWAVELEVAPKRGRYSRAAIAAGAAEGRPGNARLVLATFAAAVQRGQYPPPEYVAFAAEAFARILAGENPELALGLARRGRPLATFAEADRDFAIAADVYLRSTGRTPAPVGAAQRAVAAAWGLSASHVRRCWERQRAAIADEAASVSNWRRMARRLVVERQRKQPVL